MLCHLKLLVVCLLLISYCDGRSVLQTEGPVTPCAYTTCLYGSYCTVRDGQATCECPPICMTFVAEKPICGSDGETYYGICAMEHFACMKNKIVTKVSDGECPKRGKDCKATEA